MTQEELQQYVELSEKFDEACETVQEMFCNTIDPMSGCYGIQNADAFAVNGDWVCWSGAPYGYACEGSFPITYLTMSQQELHKIAVESQTAYNKKISNQEEDYERKLYERLKKKYEL